MATFQPLKSLGSLPFQPGKPMPVLFIGHGSPMNGIENNEFSIKWAKLGNEIPTPRAVLCVSAHWLTRGTYVTVLQLSIDYDQPSEYHYRMGKELNKLRKKGVWIIGSGNMIHNLRMVAWDKLNEPEYGFDWAVEMNDLFKKNILSATHQNLIDYQKLGEAALKAIPTPDHYYPLLYTLGVQTNKDEIEIFNDKAVGGSLTMTSVRIG